jgi:hypothetical protein
MVACAGAGSRGSPSTESQQRSVIASHAPVTTAPACISSPLPPALQDAVASLHGREFEKADAELLDQLAATPADFAADVLLEAIRAVVEDERSRADASIAAATPRRVDVNAPPTRPAEPLHPASIAPIFVRESDGPAGSLHPSFRPIPSDEMRRYGPPPWHAPSAPDGEVRRFLHDDHAVSVLGRGTRIVVSAARSRPLVLEGWFGDVVGARLVGNVLVLKLREGRLVAASVDSGNVIWSANARSAIFSGTWVASEGPTGIDLRDVRTGTSARSFEVLEKPRALLLHEGRLLALNGTRDVAFRIDHASPPEAPELVQAIAPPVFATAEGPCLLTHALDAIGRRDQPGLDRTLEALRAREGTTAIASSLAAVSERLRAWSTGRRADRIDIFSKPITVLAAPPWKRTPPPGAPSRGIGHVIFRQRSAIPDNSWEHDPPLHVRPNQDVGIAPAERGVPPPGARTDAPRFFGVASLVRIQPKPDHVLLSYGERWLAVVRGQETERFFDLAGYAAPPFVPKGQHVFPGAPTYVNEALLRDGVLYLCDGGGSYAAMAGGMKSYVTALAYPSGEIMWRSQPLVCSSALIPWRGYLITGYGFTAEPDFLYAIRASDGSVAGRVAISTAPIEISLDGNDLKVTAYRTRYVFTLSE